jgi:drug/metabolite transporter (DMT)-like permease
VHSKDNRFLPHLALVAVQFLFGTWPILGKLALRALPSAGLVAFRICGAAICFLIIQRFSARDKIKIARGDYARIALYSLLGVILNQFFYIKGLALSTAINAILISTAIPVSTLLVGIALRLERPSLRKFTGIALAALGVIYLIDPTRADFEHSTALGNLLLVANTIVYGAYIAISQQVIRRYGALTVITWIFVFGSFAALPIGGFYLAQTPLENVSWQVWLTVAVIILLPTVGAYYLNAFALSRVSPSTVAIYIYLQPLFAFSLAPFVLGESWNSRTWIAAILIFIGVATVTWRARRSPILQEISEHPDAIGH